jgi:hypothetical protein
MDRILRRRPSPAMVVAFIALCVALAGTATALPGRARVKKDDIARAAVRARHIKSGNILNRHIKTRAVSRSKIAKNAINTDLVAHDGLTGADVLEASFGRVPDASHLDGKDASAFESADTVQTFGGEVKMNVGDADRDLLTVGPFTLTAHCADSGSDTVLAQVLITTSEAGSAFAGDQDSDADFNPSDADNPAIWAQEIGGTVTGGAATINSALGNDEISHALAPTGTAIAGGTTIATNFAGFDCVFAGRVMVE